MDGCFLVRSPNTLVWQMRSGTLFLRTTSAIQLSTFLTLHSFQGSAQQKLGSVERAAMTESQDSILFGLHE